MTGQFRVGGDWVCPECGRRNPGALFTCRRCQYKRTYGPRPEPQPAHEPPKTVMHYARMSRPGSCPGCAADYFAEDVCIERDPQGARILTLHCPECSGDFRVGGPYGR